MLTSRNYRFGEYHVNCQLRRLYRSGEIVPLTAKVFDLLVLLLENANEAVEKEKIIERLWAGEFVEENNLSQCVKNLRKALGETAKNPIYVQTIPRHGFMLATEVSVAADSITAGAEKSNSEDSFVLAAEDFVQSDDDKPLVYSVVLRPSNKKYFVAAAVFVLVISLIVASVWRRSDKANISDVKSIAVLPMIDLSSKNESGDNLGLGMTDTLITRFGNLSQISVLPTAAVIKFNQQQRDVGAIAKQLAVDAVLDGNFKREGDRLRVNVQLIDARQKRVLWSETFVESADEAIFIQDKIAEEIAETLRLELTNDERRFLAQRYTNSAQAYRLYLKAREIHLTTGAEGFVQARALYGQAVALDGNFALAYVGLAGTYSAIPLSVSAKQSYQTMNGYARRALEIDDNLADAHQALAVALWRGDWNWREAETHFKRALEINPRHLRASSYYAMFLMGQGRFDEAHTTVDRVLQEKPNETLMLWMKATLWHYSRQYDRAEKSYLDILQKQPTDNNAIAGLTLLYIIQNRLEETQPMLEKIRAFSEIATENFYIASGLYYARRGDEGKAREMIAELTKLSQKQAGALGGIALIYTVLGEKDKAFEFLNKSVEEREHFGYLLKVNPLYDNLRDDVRFTEMLRKANLE